MYVFLVTSLAHVRSGPFELHVDTNDVGDTLIAYGKVEGFSALVVGDTEYEIREGSRHRIRKGTPHAVIGGGKREVSAIDEVTGLEVGAPCLTLSCCHEYKLELTGSVIGSDEDIELNNINQIVEFESFSTTAERPWSVHIRPETSEGEYSGTSLWINHRTQEIHNTIRCDSASTTCPCPEDFPFEGRCENISMSCYRRGTEPGAIIAISAGVVVLVLTCLVLLHKD